jgi:hypothetical protein
MLIWKKVLGNDSETLRRVAATPRREGVDDFDSKECSSNHEWGNALPAGGGTKCHLYVLGSCGESVPQDRNRLAIGAPRVRRHRTQTTVAPVSQRRIAFVFEVFGRSIPSWKGGERKSVAARERFRTTAVGIQGTGWRPGRSKFGPLRKEKLAKAAGTYGDQASIARASLRTFPGSIDQSRRQFLLSNSQRD